ncbi:MAG: hypothetical protein JXB49_21295 [Bacteroidales bacterium]|nr:hypothetical protein [Bacteroidales bacterium]
MKAIYIQIILLMMIQSVLIGQQDTTNRIKYDAASRILSFPGSAKNIIQVKEDERVNVSNNGKKAAVLKLANPGMKETTLEIYNTDDKINQSYKVKPLSDIIISNDGRYVLYGYEPTNQEALISKITMYSNTGEELELINRSFGITIIGCFSDKNNYLVFLADSVPDNGPTKTVELYVFNNQNKLLNRYSFTDWTRESYFIKPKFSDDEEEIHLFRYDNKKNKETLIVNVNNYEIKKESGWKH